MDIDIEREEAKKAAELIWAYVQPRVRDQIKEAIVTMWSELHKPAPDTDHDKWEELGDDTGGTTTFNRCEFSGQGITNCSGLFDLWASKLKCCECPMCGHGRIIRSVPDGDYTAWGLYFNGDSHTISCKECWYPLGTDWTRT
jgi:hypothetical protein